MSTLRHALGIATLLAGVLGAFYLWNLLDGGRPADGLTLTLVFDRAEGLSPGAPIRYRGVEVGTVRWLRLARGGEAAEAVCDFAPEARPTLRVTSRFWVVRPRFLGVSRGASGLETLVKDSYITYTSPTDADLLTDGSRVPGLPGPPEEIDERVEDARAGDLEIRVFFPESGGLEVGNDVRYRGLKIGVVHAVNLAGEGEAVLVRARIDRDYRGVIYDATRFWVARPSVNAGWLSGVDVHDLDALLAGTYLTFMTPRELRSSPAAENAEFVGLVERPDFDWARIDPNQVAARSRSAEGGGGDDPLHSSGALVTVHTSFTVSRWIGRDREHSMSRMGLFVHTRDGVPAVIVPRSSVDPRWSRPEGIDGGKVRAETFRIELPDGAVYEAGRVWVDAEGADLAVLSVDSTIPPPPPFARFRALSETPGPAEIFVRDEGGQSIRRAVTIAPDGTVTGITAAERGGIVVQNGAAVAVIGVRTPASDDEPAGAPVAVPLDRIPDSLRSRE